MNNKKNKKGFTLAEVLITLAIIGVISSILLPSILANYTERTLRAKKQALFSRMSQAMAEMADTFGNYAELSCTDINNPLTCTDKGSSIKFINEGLSKAYKIAAVCDNDNLSACDIPEKITRENGTVFNLLENSSTFTKYNPGAKTLSTASLTYDLKSAGLKTKNGESILLFYNPSCLSKVTYTDGYVYTETMMCVNMIYDLNGGKNKPNRMGEDIGFMTVFYNDMPYVAAPRPYDWKGILEYDVTTDASGREYTSILKAISYEYAKSACSSLGNNVVLPSREEAMAMQVNRELWFPLAEQINISSGAGWMASHLWAWTNTMAGPNFAWTVIYTSSQRGEDYKDYTAAWSTEGEHKYIVRCIYTD